MTELDEHTASGLLAKLAADCDATPQQLDFVRRVLDLFKSKGVVEKDRGLPLFEACPCAEQCWGPFRPEDYPPPEQAEAAVPWVGREYARHGIAVAAINFNSYGGLGAQWWVRRGDIQERLGQGKRTQFPYRVGQYLAALVASQRGEPVIADTDPTAGAAGFESCAFIQGVQCSPRPNVGRPSAAMWENCPPRYLSGQLELLQPRVVLAVGRETWRWIQDLCAVQVHEAEPSFWRGRGALAGDFLDALFVNHPSYGNWRHSLPRLIGSLQRAPLDPCA